MKHDLTKSSVKEWTDDTNLGEFNAVLPEEKGNSGRSKLERAQDYLSSTF